jgi:hypothetical protein
MGRRFRTNYFYNLKYANPNNIRFKYGGVVCCSEVSKILTKIFMDNMMYSEISILYPDSDIFNIHSINSFDNNIFARVNFPPDSIYKKQ